MPFSKRSDQNQPSGVHHRSGSAARFSRSTNDNRSSAHGQQEQMIRHDHVSEESEPSGRPRFIDRFASDNLDGIGLKDGQPVLRNNRDVKRLGIS
jgi:hypothetical protein